MTKEQFIASVEAKPNFKKWAVAPKSVETLGDIEKWHGIAYIATPDGTNTFNVWFMVDTETGEATWQTQDTLEPEKNTTQTKINVLTNYLKANFFAFFIYPGKMDLENSWVEAEVLIDGQTLTRKNVLVYKKQGTPLTHKEII